MTELYGPPQRFKTVNTKTGDVIIPNLRLGTGCGLGVLSNCEIYQSTGHHDKNGVEVFFGDVVWCDHCDDMLVVISSEAGVIELSRYNDRRYTMHTSRVMDTKELIGNIHTPPDVLKARAQEVRG